MKLNATVLLLAGALLISAGASAQGLPNLEKASEITTGSLPDGISYYLVTNKNTPGFADFALVQPVRSDLSGPREDLVTLPHFEGRKPYEFLVSNAVSSSRNGYVRHLRNSTIFRFADVPVFRAEVADSTLLMLFDIARGSEYEQAIVLSGDIDVTAVVERIRILSMTISRRKPVDDNWNYGWEPQDKPTVTVDTAPVGMFTVRYRSPRTDRELMNTIQPLMSRLLATELDVILARRLRAAFDDAGVPLADYRYHYTGSDETPGDELFTFTVCTEPAQLERAVETVAGVLSTLDKEGATVEEVGFARSLIAEEMARENQNHKAGNAEYVDKCIAAYLYGSNLASYPTLSSVFTGRKLDVGRECELLNRYVSSTLSPNRNLQLRAICPVTPDPDRVLALFSKGWTDGYIAAPDIPSAQDTLKLSIPKRKVKLKSATTDAYTGGLLWTFSNGVSVVFKKTADKGEFHYGAMIKGGWPEIPGINGTESAFAEEVLALGSIAGMSSTHLTDLLGMFGVTIKPQLTVTDMRFTGAAPPDALSLVIKTMLAAVNDYEQDSGVYLRYRKEKAVRLMRDKYTDAGTRAVLDSIMCPGYSYAAGSLPSLPKNDFPVRLGQYVSQKGANFKNGLIVLIGDLDEAKTLRLLTQSLGVLKTSQQRVARPKMNYPIRDCWTTNFMQRNWRGDAGVSLALGALYPYGSEGFGKMQLACTVLKTELNKALAKDGMCCTVNGKAELLPAEKITIYLHCHPVAPNGLPADVKTELPVRTLQTVREVVNRLAGEEVDKQTLSLAKVMITNQLKAQDGNTAMLRDAVLTRNSLGRDIRSGYAQRIKNVSAADLNSLFSKLAGCDCEFVVQ